MCKTFLDNNDYKSIGVKGDKDSDYKRYDFNDDVKNELVNDNGYRVIINNNMVDYTDKSGMLVDSGCDYMSIFVGDYIS